MKYKGSCHCGRISYEVEGDIESVMQCNCSICSRRGHLLWFVPREKLRLSTPESDLATYTFNKRKIQHHFCPVCGCAPFAEGSLSDKGKQAAVNVRCLEGVDPSQFKIIQFDGRRL